MGRSATDVVVLLPLLAGVAQAPPRRAAHRDVDRGRDRVPGVPRGLAVWVLGRARLSEPDVEPWLDGEEPAIPSPRVLALTRR
jgi:hypothetical protein